MFTSPEQQAAQNYGGTLMQFGDVLEKYKKGDLKKEDAKSQCDVLMKQLETYGDPCSPLRVNEQVVCPSTRNLFCAELNT
eukprot:2047827-Amphidinium_carterae.2